MINVFLYCVIVWLFLPPDIEVLVFPAWDCLPYDRVSPRAEVIAQRITTMAAIATTANQPRIVLTTVNASLQKIIPKETIIQTSLIAKPGQILDIEHIQNFLSENGFSRSGTVVDPGDYAVRGGIIDIFAPGTPEPVRLDFFGDTLESIRTFDAETQRTTGQQKEITLLPAGEVLLTSESISKFRTGYVAQFGGVTGSDPLFEAVSAGRIYQGMEHWLPLFHDTLGSVFDLYDWWAISEDHRVLEVRNARLELIVDYHQARIDAMEHDSFRSCPLISPCLLRVCIWTLVNGIQK